MVKVSACVLAFLAACTTTHPDNGAPVCGDGVTTPGVNGTGEECDYSDPATSAHCDMTCHVVAYCGDGRVDTAAGETCDDGNTMSGDGCSATCKTESSSASYTISASWTLKNVAKAVQVCPVGFDSAALYSQRVDAAGNPLGAPAVDVFNCNSPGAGITTPLPAGLYDVSLEIQNHALTSIYASTIKARVDLTTMNKTFSADLYTDGGYFGLAWKLVKATDHAMTVTCTQAGVGANGGTEIVSTDSANMGMSDIFTCDDGAGTTAVLLMGNYTVSVDVFGNNMISLGASDVISSSIMGQNKVTDLGVVTIPIDGL